MTFSCQSVLVFLCMSQEGRKACSCGQGPSNSVVVVVKVSKTSESSFMSFQNCMPLAFYQKYFLKNCHTFILFSYSDSLQWLPVVKFQRKNHYKKPLKYSHKTQMLLSSALKSIQQLCVGNDQSLFKDNCRIHCSTQITFYYYTNTLFHQRYLICGLTS